MREKRFWPGAGIGGDGQRGQDFLPIVFNHNFTYEMVEPQGKIAMDGNFREASDRMSVASDPSAWLQPYSISLVKFD